MIGKNDWRVYNLSRGVNQRNLFKNALIQRPFYYSSTWKDERFTVFFYVYDNHSWELVPRLSKWKNYRYQNMLKTLKKNDFYIDI